MATGVYTDFKIYNDQFYAGLNETIQQNVEAFNGASNNAIRLVPSQSEGHFREEAFFKQISSLIARNDTTTVSDSTDGKLESDDIVSPKCSWKIQVANTLDSLKRIASNEQEFSFLLGEQTAIAKMQYMLNFGVKAAVTCFGLSTNNYVSSTGATIDYDDLVDGLNKFGDKANSIVAFVGHSKPTHDLQKAAFDITVENVAGNSINAGVIPSLGKAWVTTDSTDLIDSDGASTSPEVASYKTLGLVENAIVLTEAGNDTMYGEVVTGKGPLLYRMQGEGDFLVTVKGFQYDKDPINPTAAQIATAGNWSQVAAETKLTGGFYIETR